MSLQITLIPPLDPNLKTGPTRMMSGVARTLVPVTGTPYGEYMTWLYVGAPGDVSYIKWDGTNELLVGLASGVFHPIFSIGINLSGTTAGNIVVGS